MMVGVAAIRKCISSDIGNAITKIANPYTNKIYFCLSFSFITDVYHANPNSNGTRIANIPTGLSLYMIYGFETLIYHLLYNL